MDEARPVRSNSQPSESAAEGSTTIVAAYLRCSTKSQDLEGQHRLVTAWAEKHGHNLVIYEDDATSGRKTDRKGLEAMVQAAEAGQVNLVAVAELSRIGRSVTNIASTVERLSKCGVKVVLVNSGALLDYESLEGRALIHALAMAADIEWCLIQERCARGRATIKERGIKVGAKQKVVSPAVLKALREKGLSIRQIAKELNISSATIGRRVKAS